MPEVMKPNDPRPQPERQPPIYASALVGNMLLALGVLFMVLFVACAWFLLTASDVHKPLALLLGACWAVGVPTWFFIEHIYFFRKWGDATQFDQFKRLQDQATKIWIAAAGVLAAISATVFPGPCGQRWLG